MLTMANGGTNGNNFNVIKEISFTSMSLSDLSSIDCDSLTDFSNDQQSDSTDKRAYDDSNYSNQSKNVSVKRFAGNNIEDLIETDNEFHYRGIVERPKISTRKQDDRRAFGIPSRQTQLMRQQPKPKHENNYSKRNVSIVVIASEQNDDAEDNGDGDIEEELLIDTVKNQNQISTVEMIEEKIDQKQPEHQPEPLLSHEQHPTENNRNTTVTELFTKITREKMLSPRVRPQQPQQQQHSRISNLFPDIKTNKSKSNIEMNTQQKQEQNARNKPELQIYKHNSHANILIGNHHNQNRERSNVSRTTIKSNNQQLINNRTFANSTPILHLRKMNPVEIQQSVNRLYYIPKRSFNLPQYKSLHQKSLSKEDIEAVSLRLYKNEKTMNKMMSRDNTDDRKVNYLTKMQMDQMVQRLVNRPKVTTDNYNSAKYNLKNKPLIQHPIAWKA